MVPALLVAAIVMLIQSQQFPLYFLALLLVLAISSVSVAVAACGQLIGPTLTLNPDGFSVSRLFSTKTFAWADIESIRIVPQTRTFGDDPFTDTSQRFGLGVFLRKTDASHRETDDDPDVVVCAGGSANAEALVAAAEQLKQVMVQAQSGRRNTAPRRAAGPARANQFSRRAGGLARSA